MGMFRPIPRSALPDEMCVRLPLPDGGYGEPRVVANVRFERTQSVSDDPHRSADAGAGMVFVDAANSAGAFEVPAGARVAVGGRELFVRSCFAACDLLGRVHHWELEVG